MAGPHLVGGAEDHTPLYRLLYRHAWLAFLSMGLGLVLLGVASLNLYYVFREAWGFLWRHGLDAVREGVLWQLGELMLSGYVAAACYVLTKLCEKVLVERLSYGRRPLQDPDDLMKDASREDRDPAG